jgi:hypothetical protein
MIRTAVEIEQPIASANRLDQPVLALDHRLDRRAVGLEFGRHESPFRLRIPLGDELQGEGIVVVLEMEMHKIPDTLLMM